MNDGVLKQRYHKLKTVRDTFLNRGRECSKLTIPSLVPPEGNSEGTTYPTPYQGLGARGVNNLASKLLLALLPPNTTFFKMIIDDFQLEQLAQKKGARAEVEEALNKVERAVQTEIEGSGLRIAMFEALKQLLVAGNALLYLPDTGGMRVFKLNQYVVKRDPVGNLLEIITVENVAPSTLPLEVRMTCDLPDTVEAKTVEVYTRVVLNAKDMRWDIAQEIKGKIVPGSEGFYPLDKNPFIPIRYTSIHGEDYGRSFVEEYHGDLKSLEALTKAIVEGSAAAAKVLFLVNPNGATNKNVLAKSDSGAIVSGNAADVTTLQLEKFNDFRVAKETIDTIERRLSFAFMLNTSVQRNGERVTAEEIRYMAGELEDALGGVYSVQSQELQLPLVNRLLHVMQEQGKLPLLPDNIKPQIVTGVQAIGRGHDLNKLNQFLQGLAPMGELAFNYINMGDYIKRFGTSLGIDMDGLVKSAEQLQAEQEQAQQQQMMQQATPEVIKQVGNAVGKQME